MNREILVSKMRELLTHHTQEIDALEKDNDYHCIHDTYDNHDYNELMELVQSQSSRTNSSQSHRQGSARLSTKLLGDKAAAADDWERSRDEALRGIAASLLVAHTAHRGLAGTSRSDTVSEGMKETLRVLAEGGISGEAFRNLRLRLLEQLLSAQREKILA